MPLPAAATRFHQLQPPPVASTIQPVVRSGARFLKHVMYLCSCGELLSRSLPSMELKNRSARKCGPVEFEVSGKTAGGSSSVTRRQHLVPQVTPAGARTQICLQTVTPMVERVSAMTATRINWHPIESRLRQITDKCCSRVCRSRGAGSECFQPRQSFSRR